MEVVFCFSQELTITGSNHCKYFLPIKIESDILFQNGAFKQTYILSIQCYHYKIVMKGVFYEKNIGALSCLLARKFLLSRSR
jgi:hypothetical protein